MYYELNVSHSGKHFFATDRRSLTDIDKAMAMFELFKMLFTPTEGYAVSLYRWETLGTIIATTNKETL